MKKASEKAIRSKRRGDPVTSAERSACNLISDGGTILEICVAFLIVSMAVTAHIICDSLLLLLTRAIALLWLHFSRQYPP